MIYSSGKCVDNPDSGPVKSRISSGSEAIDLCLDASSTSIGAIDEGRILNVSPDK